MTNDVCHALKSQTVHKVLSNMFLPTVNTYTACTAADRTHTQSAHHGNSVNPALMQHRIDVANMNESPEAC